MKFKKAFRYEEAWTEKEGCTEAVKVGWAAECNGSPMYLVTEKIKATRIRLLKWASRETRKIPGEIAATKDKLNNLFG